SVDYDFNINRMERYLTICNASNVEPLIILNKIDLINESELSELILSVQKRVKDAPVIAISNESQKGIESLKKSIIKGKTYCLLGSSGVGKSSLLNSLSGKQHMKTNSISLSTNKGRHITSHRELLILENGGIMIDNPGMREVGIADSTGGLERTFDVIVQLAGDCKFKDCTHTTEIDCAVVNAVDKGEIDQNSYENYLKMEREKEHFDSTIAERRKKDKDFGKMIKHFKNTRKSNKF
ncbi:MAG TPA: ribosome small subunit-dependent GTPase A, partial [Draconibacterium sp.]|nr:ribosome small subunit-dependent GTPase A [Draconibacterium sp.]